MQKALPLSKFQQSIWKGQKLNPNAPLYNMVFTFDIFGDIEPKVFKEAFSELIDTSTILRLVVDESNPDQPMQRTSDRKMELQLIDLTEDSSIDFDKWLEEHNQMNFDLSQSSYYCALIKKTDEHYIWYFNQHHIFTDAYCFQLLFNKMSSLYSSILNGDQELKLENDFESYASSCKTSEELEVSSTRNNKNNFSLYGSQFPNTITTASKRTSFSINQETVDSIFESLNYLKLRTIAANLDMLTYLISTLVITISKVGNDDKSIELSNIFSQRFSKNTKHLAKPLLEIFNKRIAIESENLFIDIYQEVYSFLIMRQSKVATDEQSLPNTIINFFDLNFEDFAGYKTSYHWRHCGHMDAHHFLRFHIFRYKSTDPYTFAFDIKSGHNSNNLGTKLADDYKNVLNKLVKLKSDIPLKKLCLVSKDELLKLQTRASSIHNNKLEKRDYFINVLQDQIKKNPDSVALQYKDEKITYRELKEKAICISDKLNSLNIGNNSKVIIYLPRSSEFIFSMIGVLFSGGTFIPVPTNFPLERLKYISNNVEADLIIHNVDQIELDTKDMHIDHCFKSVTTSTNRNFAATENFYILFTSGSSGKPKGVPISQSAITSYLQSASALYIKNTDSYHMPFFTSVGFDLTMTSILLPLYTGGSISIYEEAEGIDLSIREVLNDKTINCFKCTPSHLKLTEGLSPSHSIQSVIVGGENFTRKTAQALYEQYNNRISIFNEYGPTEATIGCIVYKFDANAYIDKLDIPIGHPLNNSFAFIANQAGIPLPNGVIGELCIGGLGLANEYVNDQHLTTIKFAQGNEYIPFPFYKTGDYASINEQGDFEYLGREDAQVKVGGIRIETGEIEHVIANHDSISQCVVAFKKIHNNPAESYTHCTKCGLPSNYPTADFDQNNVCGYCRNFETYETKVAKYFKTEDDFGELFASSQNQHSEYDCIMLFSGGKDSSYALGKLVEKGLKVLAFTLDNGYIPDSAKENIKRVVGVLGVDHVFGSSPAMNDIFIDSLKTHCNVCNGCFKTIYNLSLKLAYDKNIPFIITGLSRGQFFETKLSEEIFWKPMLDTGEIEETLFAARKAYHGVKDLTYEKTDGEFIQEHQVLDKVQIVDFYRYHDVTLENLYAYINTKLPWVRPEDTGRSTNCLINKVGIYVHKQQKGFSNYAFPYSWDVRTGHKTKEETIDEIEEYIDENEVKKIIEEIGYNEEASTGQLVAYCEGEAIDTQLLKSHVAKYLPEYMVPMKYVFTDQIPLTSNGKVDYKKLEQIQPKKDKPKVEPTNEIEEILLSIWEEVLNQKELSIDDDFFELGGTSLDAIRIVSRLENSIQYKLPVNYVFQIPTIQELSAHIMKDMMSIIESNSK